MSASETQTGAGGGGTGVGVIITATATSNRDDNSSSIPGIQLPPPPPPPPLPPQPQHQPQPLTIDNLSFPYPTDALNLYKPPLSASVGIVPNHFSLNSGSTLKRKRGRPRKYAPDGSIVTPLVHPPPPHPTPSPPVTITSPFAGNYSPSAQQQQPLSVAAPPPSETRSLLSSSTKKARARPPSSAKNQQVQPLGSAAIGITAHVIIVKPGEDVSAKIISFSQNSNKAICILSANGAISNVTLCQVATSGGTATYEGLFNILSLSGSFWLAELGNLRSRTGGLSVILAGPDGRVLGGCVAGLLIAASPVQIIVGSFMADGPEEAKKVNNMEFLHASLKVNLGGEARSLSSHKTLAES